ncbi:hypothetical protein GGF50DRAFT_85215 [Schizophyllum commune]
MASTHDLPVSSGSKTFGIHKYNPEYCLGSGAQREDRRRGYEDKYEDDALYEELGDDARIWRVMLDEGRASDAAMLQRFRDHLDVDLVFAGLFSAVLTTFVAQTSQTPSDTGDTTIALLLEIIAIQRAWANNPRVNDVASFSLPPPSPSPSPWINRCWFLSLIFSLLAAFGAVVVRQWLQEYESDITGPPKRRALVRHYRRVGLEKYKVHLIVPILPMLLHVSLLLFFVGLSLYVRQSDRSMSNGIIALTAMIYVVYLGTNILPVFRPQCPYRSPLSTGSGGADIFREALKNSWKEVFKTPDAPEWEAVLNSSDTMIPDSLGSMAQASSDLSVTPLVVQASSSFPIDHTGIWRFKDSRYKVLLQRLILPWFINALSTQRAVFDWVPGRENELQRMACSLLLVPANRRNNVPWDEINTTQYHTCILWVLQALTSALLDLLSTSKTATTDVATLSMTIFALGNRLDDLEFDPNSIKIAHSLTLSLLLIWHNALRYLRCWGRSMDNTAHFAIALWRTTSTRVTLQDWLYHLSLANKWSRASRLHTACHAIDSFVKADNTDGDAAFDLLVAHFMGLLHDALGYESIEPALQMIGHSTVSAAFKSTFLVRPCLSLAKFSEPNARLPATFAASLLHFFVELATAAEALDYRDKQLVVPDIFRALDHHSTEYHDALTEEFPIEYLRPAIEIILWEPQLAVLESLNGIVALLATQLSKSMTPTDLPAYDLTWFLYLDALYAACANSNLVDKRFSDASPYHGSWNSALNSGLEDESIPLAVALALKSTHGRKALAEWMDDVPTLVQDPTSGLVVQVPTLVSFGIDQDWYRLFTSDPDKHIHGPDRYKNWVLHISELVSFEEAVERMQKTDAERAAKKPQRSSRGDGAEVDANNDAENAGRVHGGLANQGGAERTENETADRLRTLGAWVSTSFKSVRPFLELAVTERSGGDPHISAWASEGGSDGEHAQDDAQAQEDAQARDDEQSHDDERARDGEQDQDSSQDQEDAHAQDDERPQAEEVPHVQRGQTPDEGVGTDAREDVGSDAHEDVEYGGTTSARGTPDAGRGGEQGHDGEQGHEEEQARDDVHGQAEEQVRGGEHGQAGEHDQTGEPARGDQHGWDGGHGQDGEQARAGAQDPNSAQSQAHEVPHAQTQKEEVEAEIRAQDDAADEGEH